MYYENKDHPSKSSQKQKKSISFPYRYSTEMTVIDTEADTIRQKLEGRMGDFQKQMAHGKPAEEIVKEHANEIFIFGKVEPYRDKRLMRLEDVELQDGVLEYIRTKYKKSPESNIENEYLRGAGRDILATQIAEDGEPNGIFIGEVKSDLAAKAIYRTRHENEAAPILQVELKQGKGWLYQYIYAQKWNNENYNPHDEKSVYATTPNQIVYILCFDREGKRPYASVCFRFGEFFRSLNALCDGKLTEWESNKNFQFADKYISAGRISGYGNMWEVPIDAMIKAGAEPRVRLFNIPERSEAELDYKDTPPSTVTITGRHFGTIGIGRYQSERDRMAERRLNMMAGIAEPGSVEYYGTELHLRILNSNS